MKGIFTGIDCCYWSMLLLSIAQAVPVSWNPANETEDQDVIAAKNDSTWLQNDGKSNDNPVCLFEDQHFTEGQIRPSENPCEVCTCHPPEFICSLRTCDVKPGCKALHSAGKCCPEYVCDCQKNGRTYGNGEKVEEPNPCNVCYCRGGEIKCTGVTCYTRPDCEPHYVPGKCCPKYDHCPAVEMKDRLPVAPALTEAPESDNPPPNVTSSSKEDPTTNQTSPTFVASEDDDQIEISTQLGITESSQEQVQVGTLEIIEVYPAQRPHWPLNDELVPKASETDSETEPKNSAESDGKNNETDIKENQPEDTATNFTVEVQDLGSTVQEASNTLENNNTFDSGTGINTDSTEVPLEVDEVTINSTETSTDETDNDSEKIAPSEPSNKEYSSDSEEYSEQPNTTISFDEHETETNTTNFLKERGDLLLLSTESEVTELTDDGPTVGNTELNTEIKPENLQTAPTEVHGLQRVEEFTDGPHVITSTTESIALTANQSTTDEEEDSSEVTTEKEPSTESKNENPTANVTLAFESLEDMGESLTGVKRSVTGNIEETSTLEPQENIKNGTILSELELEVTTNKEENYITLTEAEFVSPTSINDTNEENATEVGIRLNSNSKNGSEITTDFERTTEDIVFFTPSSDALVSEEENPADNSTDEREIFSQTEYLEDSVPAESSYSHDQNWFVSEKTKQSETSTEQYFNLTEDSEETEINTESVLVKLSAESQILQTTTDSPEETTIASTEPLLEKLKFPEDSVTEISTEITSTLNDLREKETTTDYPTLFSTNGEEERNQTKTENPSTTSDELFTEEFTNTENSTDGDTRGKLYNSTTEETSTESFSSTSNSDEEITTTEEALARMDVKQTEPSSTELFFEVPTEITISENENSTSDGEYVTDQSESEIFNSETAVEITTVTEDGTDFSINETSTNFYETEDVGSENSTTANISHENIDEVGELTTEFETLHTTDISSNYTESIESTDPENFTAEGKNFTDSLVTNGYELNENSSQVSENDGAREYTLNDVQGNYPKGETPEKILAVPTTESTSTETTPEIRKIDNNSATLAEILLKWLHFRRVKSDIKLNKTVVTTTISPQLVTTGDEQTKEKIEARSEKPVSLMSVLTTELMKIVQTIPENGTMETTKVGNARETAIRRLDFGIDSESSTEQTIELSSSEIKNLAKALRNDGLVEVSPASQESELPQTQDFKYPFSDQNLAPVLSMISDQLQFLRVGEELPIYMEAPQNEERRNQHGEVVVPVSTPITVHMVKVKDGYSREDRSELGEKT